MSPRQLTAGRHRAARTIVALAAVSSCLAALAYAANGEIADSVRPIRPDVITAFCPSTVEGNATRGDIHVLTFGMSHKLLLPYFEKLKALLDDSPKSYTIGLSCAVHEGNPWDEGMRDAESSLRVLFGNHLRVLGYLADDALVREIDSATAVAAFYTPAFRANNTSGWAVLERGRTLISNRDEHSPRIGGWYDINELICWPSDDYIAGAVANGPQVARAYGWEKLRAVIQGQSCAK